MARDDNEKTFIGFWPADDNHSSLESLSVETNGTLDLTSRRELQDTLFDFETNEWHIIISKDYMCLIHLKSLEDTLNTERENNRTGEIHQISLGASRQIKFQYIEALNAIYFLIFSSCYTGRNNYFLHDFSEITIWQCLRIMYSATNRPLRRIQFGRASKKDMCRLGLCIEENTEGFSKIDPSIFKDAIHYWDIIFKQDLISLAAVGTKIVSEHRLESYDLSVVLAWFEIESWIMEFTRTLGIQTSRTNTNTGRIYYFGIKDVIDLFPAGTTISNLASELHLVREIRNNIAHRGAMPSHDESTTAINLFIRMFNIRSGLNLSVDLHRTPSTGM
ncbi:MAG: hypothetical protein AB2689_21650 [Candidatus Thiodiazotropha taylori]